MTPRENLRSLFRREGVSYAPPDFSLCPSLVETYHARTGSDLPYADYFGFPWRHVPDIRPVTFLPEARRFFSHPFASGTEIDAWGVAHEPGSSAAMHMTRMHHPLAGISDIGRIRAYPLPDFAGGDGASQASEASAIHARGLAAVGNMQCTVWETAWYLRGMEDLMCDMMDDDPIATYLLDAVTERAITRALSFVRAGVDYLYLGDDIGTQRGPMMSIPLYREWIWPRLKAVIDAAKAENPDLLVLYHSCGLVTPFIDDLIAAGVDILNPIQSECMDFREIIRTYGDRLSFHGCIGTQTVMPFGTPQEVRDTVHACLDACGPRGGMLAAPTHLLEPEVPWENVLAYVEACASWR